MAITATLTVGEANKTNFPLEESPDNDVLGIPSKPGVLYLRKWALESLAEELGHQPGQVRLTLEAIE